MTPGALQAALERLGVAGLNALVHPDPEVATWVEGGAAAVCECLIAAFGRTGTIIMPAFTRAATLCGEGRRPRPFRPDLPVDQDLGAVPEAFRKLAGTIRTSHPTHSFSALGPMARALLSTQRDNNPLGPVKKLNVLRGFLVLLGGTLAGCPAVYLAEETASRPYLGRGTALRINHAGYEERVVVEPLPGCGIAFDRLRGAVETPEVPAVPLGDGRAVRKVPVRLLLHQARAALSADPEVFVCGRPGCAACAWKRRAADERRRTPGGPSAGA